MFVLQQAKQFTAVGILFALTVCWRNLSAHSSCLLSLPGDCTAVAAHSIVYPVCYQCLANKLVCTQFVFGYSAGCLHCCSRAQYCVSCYHRLVNKLTYSSCWFNTAVSLYCYRRSCSQSCGSCLHSRSVT